MEDIFSKFNLDNFDKDDSEGFVRITEFEGDFTEMLKGQKEGDMPVLVTRNMVNFPLILASITIARSTTRQLIKYLEKHKRDKFAMFCQKDPSIEYPTSEDLCEYGVITQFIKVFEVPGQENRIAFLAHPLARCRIGEVLQEEPYIKAHIIPAPEEEPDANDMEYQTMLGDLNSKVREYIQKTDSFTFEMQMVLKDLANPVQLLNTVSYFMPFKLTEKMHLLAHGDLKMRCFELLQLMNREIQYADMRIDIHNRTQHAIDVERKEYFLRQQLKSINQQLGREDGSPEKTKLREKAATKKWNKETSEFFEKEMERLDQLHVQSSDYNTQLTYLQKLVDLPWNEYTEDNLDLHHAERVLNRDHYGMEKVKERILEYVSVLLMRGDLKSPILCLYGPPGVGKTSLGKSIADALGRKYVRMSLGGLHDEAEIRGHRRTYVGAMPGRIIKCIEKAGSSNPVLILDEIDKVTQNTINGDPASALLEVLDPEQNTAFHDNYLDLDYDLSKVLFIATANDLSTIPSPLRDRMEIIELSGYTTEEKTEIAKRHLVPREKDKTGLAPFKNIKFPKKTLEYIVERYTRESGVRQLEKQINKALRKIAYKIAKEGSMDSSIELLESPLKPESVTELLGNPPFYRDIYQGNDYAGVVTGLAWTSVGGEILFIETSLSKGKEGKLTLTGNLGDVMKESAVIALEYVKAHAEYLNIDSRIFQSWNIHIHVPEGATPKDGPSAGITIATSIASAITQRKVRKNVAMTGEITLRGKVLPVGGIKEKLLAAKRAGITDIVMCSANKKDVEEIPEKYLKGVKFHFVENVRDVWDFALTNELVDNPLNFEIPDTK